MTDQNQNETPPTFKRFLGQYLRVELKGGWKYRGEVTEEDAEFITLHDAINGRGVCFRRDQLVRFEVGK